MKNVFYILVNKDVKMTPGKLGAQCGHPVAEMLFQSLENKEIIDYRDAAKTVMSRVRYQKDFSDLVNNWRLEGQIKIILSAPQELLESIEELEGVFPIRDLGLTELEPNTLTCIGIGPVDKDDIPEKFSFLKELKLYR